MPEIFKTVLNLSILGSVLTVVLLCLKPFTAKKLPAKWQYYVWTLVLLSMLIPVYELIPKYEAQRLTMLPQSEIVQQETEKTPETVIIDDTPIEYREVSILPDYRIGLTDLIAYLWLFGMCVYLIVVIGSYIVYNVQKRVKSVVIASNNVFDEVKNELKIKRNIKIRMSPDIQSPMLVGVVFPVIYIPCRAISDESMRMVYLHELMHYKRKDLTIKWMSLIVNAVHWFNPLAYLLCANVSEACEISCDMAVTKNMSDEEQKIYMKTILDLVE